MDSAVRTRPWLSLSRYPEQLLRFGLAILLAAMVIAQVVLFLARDGLFYAGTDRPVGGDFLVFYSAGRLLADRDGHELYSPARQLAEQQAILGRERGLAIFPYPAFAAAPYELLAGLELPEAYVIMTACLAAAGLAVLLILQRASAFVRRHLLLLGLCLFSSQPFAAALFGGQPLSFSLLCLAGLYTGMRQQKPVVAGLWLGVLSFKPQLAAVFVVVLLSTRCWRVVATAAVVATVLIGLGMVVAGPGWPLSFLALVSSDYYQHNALVVDGVRSISVPILIAHVLGPSTPATVIGVVLALALIGWLCWIWRPLDVTTERFPLQFAAAVVVTLMVSPHALFYDAGLLVLPVIFLAERWDSLGRLPTPFGPVLVGLFVLGYAWPLSTVIGFEPLAVLPPAVGVLVLRELAPIRASIAG